MSMVVKNNMEAVKTLNTLNMNQSALQKSLEKVSSGMKINSAKDDAASYSISEKMRVQLRALDQDSQNIQNASSLIKVAEGAVTSTVEILKTVKEKAINAANDTNTDSDRVTIQKEIDQFMDQVNDNALVTFNGKYLIDGSTSTVVEGGSGVNEESKNFILKGLSSEWVQSALDLVTNSFGLSFDPSSNANNATPGVQEISVNFKNEDTSFLAYVTNWSSAGSKANKLELTVNMKYYNEMDETDENGVGAGTSMYLDRTLAHEFTHAAMAANITDFNSLPKWFKEGSAELAHGADDARAVSMVNLLQNPDTLEATLNGTSDSGDNAYAAGYMLLRYMAKEGAIQTGNSQLDVVKNLMSDLVQNGADAFDSAIKNATGSKFSSKDDLINQFMTVARTAPSIDTSIKTTTNFQPVLDFMNTNFGIDTPYFSNISDNDTGAITGSDAGGANDLNAEDIVLENTDPSSWTAPTSESTTYNGLKVIWNDGTTTDISSDGSSFTYGELVMTEKKLTMQTGTEANQAINIGFYDMRTKSMGTQALINTSKSIDTDTGVYDAGYFVKQEDEDRYNALSNDRDKQAEWIETLKNSQSKTLDDISVTTKKDANVAIRIIDGAIDYALNQQTDIGSYLQRFEYTGENVMTMSENIQKSESTIRDADMAKEMTNYTKSNVLLQAAQSMLAQANQSSSAVLSLLQ